MLQKHVCSFLSRLRWDVLRHLKDTGVTGIRPCHWTRKKLADFSMRYAGRYAAPDGGVTLTYHPIYIICVKY